MITFRQGNARFNYRIVGVAIHRERVLLQKAETDDFWTLPGGRAELLESAAETLRREMREELDAEVTVGRLIWVVENFFEYDAQAYHELAFYFSMSFVENASWLNADGSFAGDEQGTPIIFQWLPLDRLEAVRLYPSFLREALQKIPHVTQHIVHRDDH